ncbi:uncharacterized protein LOC134718519 [Mytilus trossulus]|uniref:uncharacterized protein LOC134718519 n=1 Tax=Mytilus trossulus TaxID=6551 RepID=UPI003006617B
MVQQAGSVMSATCSDFTQNAWRKDLCTNCQRSRAEHSRAAVKENSPVPKKRTSVIIKTFGSSESENLKNLKSSLKSSLKGNNSHVKHANVKFVSDFPDVIGHDGGIVNLYSDDENESVSDSDSVVEELSFTEEERSFVLQALENTIWNSEVDNLNSEKNKPVKTQQNSSREFEDIKILSLWKADRFKDLKDCDAIIPKRYGTFPLRSKSKKNYIDSVFSDDYLSSNMTRTKISSVSSIGSDNEKHDSDNEPSSPYKLLDINEILYSKFEDVQTPSKGDNDDNSPMENDDEFDPDEDFFDGFLDDLDLDSSSAGMQLVDMLNGVLAKYSDSDSFRGIEDHEIYSDLPIKLSRDKNSSGPPTLRAEDIKALKGSIKSTKEFNATLANIIKKQKKKPAPKPPTSPPPPPVHANQSKTSPVQTDQSKTSPVQTDQSKTLPLQNNKTKIDRQNSDSSLKKSSSSDQNLKEPKFGMVTVGKSIIDHGQEKPLSPKRSANVFEEPEQPAKAKPENKPKRGISGFFRNILKRGKDSVDQSDQINSDSNLSKSSEVSNTSSSSGESYPVTGSDEGKLGSSNEQTKSSPEEKQSESVPKADKVKSTPQKPVPTNPRGPRTSIIMYMSESFSERKEEQEEKDIINGKDSPKTDKKELKTVSEQSTDVIKEKKLILKPQTAPPPRPQTRPKPPPNPNKPTVSPQLSYDGKGSPRQSRKTSESSLSNLEESPKHGEDNGVVRRRAKSPKRSTAPSRPAVIPVPGPDTKHSLFTKELEMRLSKNTDQTKVSVSPKSSLDGTLPKNTQEQKKVTKNNTDIISPKPLSRSSSESASPKNTIDRKSSLGPPPPSPMATSTTSLKDNNSLGKDRKSTLGAPPPSPMTTSATSIKEEPSSKGHKSTLCQPQTSPMTLSMCSMKDETKEVISESRGDHSDTSQQEVKQVEKIELPNKAQSRRSFLGKLNRKSKAPSRPQSSVKRTKSISDSQGSDLQPRKIDLSDISGPVMVTDPCGNTFPVSRRNTITIGEDPSMVSGGSTSSGSTNDKYDEWPDFSPLGSLDNLYEPIVPKEAPPPPPGKGDNSDIKTNTYDPLSDKFVDLPVSSEGYLEPVRTNPSQDSSKTGSKDVTKNNYKDKSSKIENRNVILASQPIYEEINGNDDERDEFDEDLDAESMKTDVTELQNYISRNITVSPSSSFTESDTSSASGSLNRPRPLPRKRPKPIDSSVFEQPYIAMNRPSIGMSLNESQLRETVNLLTSANLQTLREIYTHYEKEFKKDNVNLNVTGSAGPLKWRDFDIYGKPVHRSERCIVYNAKLRSNQCSCQLMLLHSRPDISIVEHPSLLHPSVIFSDMVPHSYLTDDFIKTNQLLQYSNKQPDSAKCFIAAGQFDITDNMNNHLASLEKIYDSATPSEEHLEILLFHVLQILSAISHCLEHGFSLGEANFRDVFVLAPGSRCHGNTIAFLPHQKQHDSSQVESICAYMEKYLAENLNYRAYSKGGKFHMGIFKIGKMLQYRRLESLAQVRCYIEFLLWGPKDTYFKSEMQRESNIEPKLSIWLETERANLVQFIAKERIMGLKELYSLKHFYQMKFLLKATAYMLSECVRNHLSE